MKKSTKCYCGHTTYCDCGPEEHKQETLEEVAERILLGEDLDLSDYDKRHILKAMLSIAKWHQEQSYSVDEVEDLIYKICGTVARLQGITLNGNHIDTAYNQHKTK